MAGGSNYELTKPLNRAMPHVFFEVLSVLSVPPERDIQICFFLT